MHVEMVYFQASKIILPFFMSPPWCLNGLFTLPSTYLVHSLKCQVLLQQLCPLYFAHADPYRWAARMLTTPITTNTTMRNIFMLITYKSTWELPEHVYPGAWPVDHVIWAHKIWLSTARTPSGQALIQPSPTSSAWRFLRLTPWQFWDWSIFPNS